MNIKRINEILKNKEKCDIYYEDSRVWIQELNDGIARVGFINGLGDKDVPAKDLYEGT